MPIIIYKNKIASIKCATEFNTDRRNIKIRNVFFSKE